MQEEIFLSYLLYICEQKEGDELKEAVKDAVAQYKLGKELLG